MRHLTVEEIIDFVSIRGWTEASLALIARVNGHILNCDACLKRVQAFRLIHEEFSRMDVDTNFKDWLEQNELLPQGAGIVALPNKTPEQN
jgi:hypothetical protein